MESNYLFSTALLTPTELAATCDGDEYAAYPRAEWQIAVENNDTALDYWEWVHDALVEEAADSVQTSPRPVE